MQCICLDGRKMQRTNEGYRYIYEQMNAFEGIGKNLDALYDFLTGIGKRTEIYIDVVDEMDVMIKKVILNAAIENECLKIFLTK